MFDDSQYQPFIDAFREVGLTARIDYTGGNVWLLTVEIPGAELILMPGDLDSLSHLSDPRKLRGEGEWGYSYYGKTQAGDLEFDDSRSDYSIGVSGNSPKRLARAIAMTVAMDDIETTNRKLAAFDQIVKVFRTAGESTTDYDGDFIGDVGDILTQHGLIS